MLAMKRSHFVPSVLFDHIFLLLGVKHLEVPDPCIADKVGETGYVVQPDRQIDGHLQSFVRHPQFAVEAAKNNPFFRYEVEVICDLFLLGVQPFRKLCSFFLRCGATRTELDRIIRKVWLQNVFRSTLRWKRMCCCFSLIPPAASRRFVLSSPSKSISGKTENGDWIGKLRSIGIIPTSTCEKLPKSRASEETRQFKTSFSGFGSFIDLAFLSFISIASCMTSSASTCLPFKPPVTDWNFSFVRTCSSQL
eukprot:TRINITY_DN9540_c0_g1_i3.p1 TRINITY_DN9540_c0_g1~~TRINITY_DN9540_c0_g1_i3.p1  ORF type:complete len:250 (+),score=31.56 TRINITY_DN9540_c0_g1_i3:127-876(+)